MKQLLLAVVLSVLMVGSAFATNPWYIMGNDYLNIPAQPNTDNKNLALMTESFTNRLFDTQVECDNALAAHRVSKVKIYKTDSNGIFNQTPVTLKAERIAAATCQVMD